MNIVIFAGGTGSIALQSGLYEMLDTHIDGIDTKVIVNAYDNGLSTGAVRKVCGGKILGPSDVRKNQTTRLKLEQPNSPWNKFLDIRFTVESSKAQAFCIKAVHDLGKELANAQIPAPYPIADTICVLRESIDAYFNIPVATKIDYNDFALANIVYAGFAKANGNSLREAARIMAKLMGIKDNVLLNDDRSLFLGAITKSGKQITDEGDIVSWGNVDDPFVEVFFTDENGKDSFPVLCQESITAIEKADLIILSSGTQWSSLIPTYASFGFRETIAQCKAKIVMVMNKTPDKDSPGQGASDIIRAISPSYFPTGRINLILDETSPELMRLIDDGASKLLQSHKTWNLSYDSAEHESTKSKHNPQKLAIAVGQSYFGSAVTAEHFIFDYDDTLVGRGNKFPKASAFNKNEIHSLRALREVSICTGNTIKAVNLKNTVGSVSQYIHGYEKYNPLTVFADGGVNKYLYDTRNVENADDGGGAKYIECVNPATRLSDGEVQDIITSLKDHGFPIAKIENRGNIMIAIRPVDEEYRASLLSLVTLLFDKKLLVKAAGRTTIEIMRRGVNKIAAVMSIVNSSASSITYVGDELAAGNDQPIANLKCASLRCVQVKNPAETAFFIMVAIKNGN